MPIDNVTSRIVCFLSDIGLPVTEGEVSDNSFLPGIEVQNGGLIVDRTRLKYPGDLLHEAGHLAVSPALVRPTMSGEVRVPGENEGVVEVMALLWSYAACLHLGIEPRVVFHEHGYSGHGSALLNNFELGHFPGIHHLEAAGLTLGRPDPKRPGLSHFPAMLKWLRD